MGVYSSIIVVDKLQGLEGFEVRFFQLFTISPCKIVSNFGLFGVYLVRLDFKFGFGVISSSKT